MHRATNLVKTSVILAGLVLSIPSEAGGRNETSATSTVRVSIEPFVIVSPETAHVNIAVSSAGLVSATVTFHVTANTPTVGMSAAATALYRTDDPNGQRVTPIDLYLPAGIAITPDGAGVTAGYADDTMIDGMPAKSTSVISFQSSQANRFSQDVGVTVTWDQSDPTRPAGLYHGKVRLTALIMP
jgi:hypothetical protein